MLGLAGLVPPERCRLVKYMHMNDVFNKSLGTSFDDVKVRSTLIVLGHSTAI